MSSRNVDVRAEDRSPEDVTDELVDRVIAGHGPRTADEPGRVAADLYALASAPLPVETRNRHLATIHAHGVPAPRPRLASARRRMATFAAGATAAFTLFGGGAVAAAQDAAPGDLLYGLDRAAERVQFALADDAESQASLQLDLARERLEEAARAPEHAAELIDEALDHATDAAPVQGEQALTVLGDLVATKDNPRAAQAIYDACVALAERHGHGTEPCGEAPVADDDEAPGRSGEAPGRTRTDDAQGTERGGPPEDADRGRSDGHRPGDAGPADARDDRGRPAETGTDRAGERGRGPSTDSQDDEATVTTTEDGGDVDDEGTVGDTSEDTGGGPPAGASTGNAATGGLDPSTGHGRAVGRS